MSDSKTVGMGIRLTEHQRSELETIAAETGTEVSQLIRFAVTALLQHHERCGGRLVLPIDFSEMPAEWIRAAEA